MTAHQEEEIWARVDETSSPIVPVEVLDGHEIMMVTGKRHTEYDATAPRERLAPLVAALSIGGQAPMGYRAPTDPPFAVGDRVRYNSVEFAPDDADGNRLPWLRHGEIGVVIRNTPGSAATGMMLDYGIDDEPSDGWSTVRYFDNPRYDRAVHAEAVAKGQFERVP